MHVSLVYDMFQYGHEIVPGRRVTQNENGGPPIVTDIEMDAIAVINADQAAMSGVGFESKLCFGEKEKLAEFLATFVEYLEPEGRQFLRQALDEAGGVIVPSALVPPPGVEFR